MNSGCTNHIINNESYFVILTNYVCLKNPINVKIGDRSKAARVYTIKSKIEIYECFIEFANTVDNITGKKIKMLRCDNRKEYVNKDISRLAREKGIILGLCLPYVHQLNGTVECYNRSIMDTTSC